MNVNLVLADPESSLHGSCTSWNLLWYFCAFFALCKAKHKEKAFIYHRRNCQNRNWAAEKEILSETKNTPPQRMMTLPLYNTLRMLQKQNLCNRKPKEVGVSVCWRVIVMVHKELKLWICVCPSRKRLTEWVVGMTMQVSKHSAFRRSSSRRGIGIASLVKMPERISAALRRYQSGKAHSAPERILVSAQDPDLLGKKRTFSSTIFGLGSRNSQAQWLPLWSF